MEHEEALFKVESYEPLAKNTKRAQKSLDEVAKSLNASSPIDVTSQS